MERKIAILIAVLGLSLPFSSQSILNDTTLTQKLAKANNKFAFDLLKMFGESNSVLSPIALFSALGALLAGAQNSTYRNLMTTLHLDEFANQDEINTAFFTVNTALSLPEDRLLKFNQLYIQNNFTVKGEFNKTVNEKYTTEVFSVHFENNQETIKIFNQWIETVTSGKFTGLLKNGEISTKNRMAIIIVNSFVGFWRNEFDKKNTKTENFQTTGKETMQVEMMSESEKVFNYAKISELESKILQLNYEHERIAMYLILPHGVDGLKQLKEKLNLEKFQEVIQKLKPTRLGVKVPKFDIRFAERTDNYTKQMGMTTPYDSQLADFSGIAESTSGNPLFLNQMIHVTYVRVDEKGSDSAFLAEESPKPTDQPLPSSQDQFVADHPFLLFTYDIRTHLILFMGEVYKPFFKKEVGDH